MAFTPAVAARLNDARLDHDRRDHGRVQRQPDAKPGPRRRRLDDLTVIGRSTVGSGNVRGRTETLLAEGEHLAPRGDHAKGGFVEAVKASVGSNPAEV